MQTLSRRDFVRLSTFVAASGVMAACAPPAEPAPAPAEPTTAPPAVAPAEPTSKFKEAPMLAELVAKGELPPVEERLPENPFVIEGLDGIGNYGGTWRKARKGQADHGSISHMCNCGLININQDFLIHPYVAESWEVSEDATEYTFQLRKGIKWSDGAPITAEDFRFYYEDVILNRELTTQHPEIMSSVIEGERVPLEFAAPDDFAVKYKFAEPKALFYYWGNIIRNMPASPKHYMSQFHADYADKETLDALVAEANVDDWTQLYSDKNTYHLNVERPVHYHWIPKNTWTDEFVVAERNPYFWSVDRGGNQLPYIDKVTFRDFSDKQVALMWAVNGEIDCQARHLYGFENLTMFEESAERGDYTVQKWIKTKIYGCHFNTTCKDQRLRDLFSERDFRVAVSHAVNRDEMRELIFDGYGTNMQYVPWPADNPLFYPKLANAYLEYDPDEANALLDGLGYTERDSDGYRVFKDGSGDRIAWTCIGGGTEPESDTLMIIDYMRDIGFQMNYRGLDRSLRIEMHQSNEVEMTTGQADRNLVPLADPQIWIKHTNINDRPWCNAWTAWYLDPTNPIAEEPPEGHWIWDIWGYWEELQHTVGEENQKQVFWKILDIWAEQLPAPSWFGDIPLLVIVKNGFKGIHEGYGWDCCTTLYEYVIDPATWYWDEPGKHMG